MSVASFGFWQHVKGILAAPAPPPARFGRGGVLFLVDRSVPSSPGYEWIDDHTVRIHPDAVEAMHAHQGADDE
jgi:hypothetical protein